MECVHVCVCNKQHIRVARIRFQRDNVSPVFNVCHCLLLGVSRWLQISIVFEGFSITAYIILVIDYTIDRVCHIHISVDNIM
jgi:hypothetical protein